MFRSCGVRWRARFFSRVSPAVTILGRPPAGIFHAKRRLDCDFFEERAQFGVQWRRSVVIADVDLCEKPFGPGGLCVVGKERDFGAEG